MTKLLLLGLWFLALLTAGAGAQDGILLTAVEPSRAARPRWPVTCGVPFPKGLARSTDQLRLAGPGGQLLPAQWKELGRWLEDGSLKVAACSFVADFGPGEEKAFSVTYAGGEPAPAPEQPVTVTESSEGYLITNGILQVSVRKAPFALIERLACDADGDGRFGDDETVLATMTASLQDVGGTTFTASASAPHIAVLETGPVRAALRAKGKFAAGNKQFYSYDMTLTVYAGSPLLQISHRLINTEGRPEKGYTFPPTPLQQVEVSWQLAGAAQGVTYSAGSEVRSAGSPLRIAQTGESQMSITNVAGQRQLEGQFPGWMDVNLGRVSLAVGIEDFWQLYPKAMAVTEDGQLRLELIPGLYEDFAQGMAGTHNIYLLCHRAEAGAAPTKWAAAADFGKAIHEPVMWTNPEWFSQSEVFGGPLGVRDRDGYNAMADRLLDMALRNRAQTHAFGLKTFGCWVYSPETGYGQNQYNTVLSLLLHYLRTADYRYWKTAREHFRHLADVDTVHYATHPWDKLMLGAKHSYTKDHTTSGSSPANAEGAWDCLVYYYLTGDPHAWETAISQTDAMLTFFLQPMNIGRLTPSERDSGIPLFQLCEMYKATGDKRYLEGAKLIVDYRLGVPVKGISEEQRAKGTQDPVHGCWHHSYGKGACTWLTASSLLPGLAKYYEITGEERAKVAAVKGCYWVMNAGWDPQKQQLRQKVLYKAVGGPLDESYRDYNSYYGGIINLLSLPAFQYGYELTGDEKFLRVGQDVLRSGIKGAYANRFKEFGQATKWTPFFLYHLEEH